MYFHDFIDKWREELDFMEVFVTQWHTHAGNTTTNLYNNNIKYLPELIVKISVVWNCHVNAFAMGGNLIILGIYLLTWLGLNLKWSEQVIKADDWHLKRSTARMVDLGTYEFLKINKEIITPKEFLWMITHRK